jgi:hypothetical protein
MNWAYWVFVGLTIGILIGIVRIQVVYRMRVRRLGEIREAAKRDIERGQFSFGQRFDRFEKGPSFEQQMLDLRLWTYEQLYPEREE